ncbi:MAG: hypothetical protein J6D27_00100 [Ruminiclostridium sp.]|nr:hypothetical protein [Ruminiclostridium sp.]
MSKLKAFFQNKTVKLIYTWLIVIAVGTVVLLTQFLYPLHINYSGITLTTYSGNDFGNYIKAQYDKLSEGEHENSMLLSSTGFDMTKEEDFVRVGISFNFTNIGMYKINDIQFKIDSIGKHADAFVFKEANAAEVNRFSSGIVTLHFVICTKELTTQELNEAVNSIKLSYTFNRPELFASGGNIELPRIEVKPDSIIKK